MTEVNVQAIIDRLARRISELEVQLAVAYAQLPEPPADEPEKDQ